MKGLNEFLFKRQPKAAYALSPHAGDRDLQAPGDEQFHDFIGAGIDAHHPRIAIKPRDRVLVHVAVAAEQLQAAIDNFADQVA